MMQMMNPPTVDGDQEGPERLLREDHAAVGGEQGAGAVLGQRDEDHDGRHEEDRDLRVLRDVPAVGGGQRARQQTVASEREQPAGDRRLEADAHRDDVEEDGQLDEHRQPAADVLLAQRSEVERRPAAPDDPDVLGDQVEDGHDQDRREDGDRDRALGVGGLLAQGGGQLEADEHQDAEQQALEHRAALGDVGRVERLEAQPVRPSVQRGRPR